jgi:hypothetical protein
MVSDYSDRCVKGDLNYYDMDPWTVLDEYEEPDGLARGEGASILDLMRGASVSVDQTDHLEVLGYSLLNFAVFEEKLQPLVGTEFRGFTPRWMVPAKIRNPQKPELTTGCLLIIADTRREAELGLIPGFSQQMMSRNDVMVSRNQLSFLGLSALRKDDIEVYFDVAALVEQFNAIRAETDADFNEFEGVEVLLNQVADNMRAYVPDILRENFNLTVTDRNEIEFNLKELIAPAVNLSAFEMSAPSLPSIAGAIKLTFLETGLAKLGGLLSALPFQVDLTIPDMGPLGENVNLSDLIAGNVSFNLVEQVLGTERVGNLTKYQIPIDPILDQVIGNVMALERNYTTQFLDNTLLAHNFTILEEFEAANGKFPGLLGNAIVIDCRSIQMLVSNSYARVYDRIISMQPFVAFETQFTELIKNALERVDLCKYAMTIQGQVMDQPSVYVNDVSAIKEQLKVKSDKIIGALTLESNVSISRPLLAQFDAVEQISVFLDTTMLTCTAFLALLSMQLIYSLMLSDVDDRTFEYGMLRALGFNTNNILVTVVIQSLAFAIPGVIMGMAAAAVLNAAARYVIFQLMQNELDYFLSRESVTVGLLVGFLIPMLSNILPIKQALGKNLRASLDNSRKKNEVSVEY